MRAMFSLVLLASLATTAVQAEPSIDAQTAAHVAVALALAQRPPQAPVTPQAPPVTSQKWGGVLVSDGPYSPGRPVALRTPVRSYHLMMNAEWQKAVEKWVNTDVDVLVFGEIVGSGEAYVPLLQADKIQADAPQSPAAKEQTILEAGPGKLALDGSPKIFVLRPPTVSMLIISETGCQPCMRLKAGLDMAGQGDDYPDWIYRIDHPELVAKYHVTLFPTIILLRDGKEVARRVGYASPAELKRWVDDPGKPAAKAVADDDGATECLEEVNRKRAARGLRPFLFDAKLTIAAKRCAIRRAASLCAGHTSNDFSALPAGANADAAGCAAWDGNDWGACCTYEDYTYAGAAWVRGRDGKRYMHLFVRSGGGSMNAPTYQPTPMMHFSSASFYSGSA